MADWTLTREYVANLAIGHAKGLVAEAEGKVRTYAWRRNFEELAYWEGKLAEAKAHLKEVLAPNP